MLTKTTYFRLLSFMLVVTTFLPLVHENLPKGIGSFRYLWAPLWLVSLLIFQGKIFYKKTIIHFLFYGLCLLVFIPTLWYNMDDWLVKYISEEFYWMIIIVSVLYYFIITKHYQGLAIIIKWALICIGITAIMSIIASFIDPMYARSLTASSNGFRDTIEGKIFIRLGAGQYSFGQSLICLFPILIYYYKHGKKIVYPKWVILSYMLLLYITLIRMQFFANLLLASVVIIISFLGSKRIGLSVIIVIMVILVGTIIPKSIYANFLIDASSYFDVGSENYYKMNDMAQFITTGDMETGGAGSRISRYPLLYDAFTKSTMFGNAASPSPDDISVGYHLHWMGKLAATGILGVLLFFYPHFYFLKSIFNKINSEYAFFAAISYFAFFALGCMKTITGRDIWFTYFLIIPGMYYLSSLNNTQKNI